ncbi:MAG: pilus assembly protein PilP [Halomonas sp.]|nr:pilus assembly protein PilP [Halomonas sp.]TVP46281.1 MAG: pilus assembly protein PilP [Halomonas sp.]
MNPVVLMALAVVAGGLSGCADAELDQLDSTLGAMRQSPSGQPPDATVALPDSHSLAYLYSERRSPFLPPGVVKDPAANPTDGALAPDQQRTPEPLERFQLHELRLVGTLRTGERQVAMIASPDGNVISVRVGNYVGTDHGRISHIGAEEVQVSERVFSPHDGWQERRVTLAINAQRSAQQ